MNEFDSRMANTFSFHFIFIFILFLILISLYYHLYNTNDHYYSSFIHSLKQDLNCVYHTSHNDNDDDDDHHHQPIDVR